jgi:hypothetical protein
VAEGIGEEMAAGAFGFAVHHHAMVRTADQRR